MLLSYIILVRVRCVNVQARVARLIDRISSGIGIWGHFLGEFSESA